MFEKLLILTERHIVLLLSGIFVLRVSYLFINGLDLIGDESYYWDWSRRPDWCYYSKPPMVAWLIAAFTAVGGDNAVAVRLPAVVLGTVTLGYLFATTKEAYSPKAGALAVLLVLAMPFNVLANFVMTIDAPLNCFWMMSLYYLRKALFDNNDNTLGAWFWAGVTTGAALLSKQVALLIPLMLVCFLIINQDRRHIFKRELLWYLLPVFISLLPIVLWNQQHDWVMFGHSKGHFGIKESLTVTAWLEQTSSFLLYQLLLASPVLFVLILIMTINANSRFARLGQQEQFFLLMGPQLLLGILILSFLQKVQGNWSAPFYFSAVILLSGKWLMGEWKKYLKAGIGLGYVMVLLTYTLPVVIQTFNLHNTVIDPTFRFRHWNELAKSVDQVRQEKLPKPDEAIIIALGHRFLASQLAFYLPDHPFVFRYEPSGQITSQYEVWPGPEGQLGKTAFIVTEQSEATIPVALKSVFGDFHQVGTVPNPMNPSSRYQLFIGENLKTWPKLQKIIGNIE